MCSRRRVGMGNWRESKSPTVRLQTERPCARRARTSLATLRIADPIIPPAIADRRRAAGPSPSHIGGRSDCRCSIVPWTCAIVVSSVEGAEASAACGRRVKLIVGPGADAPWARAGSDAVAFDMAGLERPDPDVPDGERSAVVALDTDVPPGCPAVVGPGGELAGLDPAEPVGAAEVVREQPPAVEPMLDVGAVHDDACRVPLTRTLHDPRRRRVQPVVRSGGGQAALAVRRVGVVQQLVLGSTPVDVVVLLGRAVEDAGVASRGDLPLQGELEVP